MNYIYIKIYSFFYDLNIAHKMSKNRELKIIVSYFIFLASCALHELQIGGKSCKVKVLGVFRYTFLCLGLKFIIIYKKLYKITLSSKFFLKGCLT